MYLRVDLLEQKILNSGPEHGLNVKATAGMKIQKWIVWQGSYEISFTRI